MKSQKSVVEWRQYFESGNCGIYQIIYNAIRVAALDEPEEFKLRRSKILERLYSCQFTGDCFCADHTTEQDVHTTITQVFRDCKKACVHETTNKVDDSEVAGGGGRRATDQQANETGKNIVEDDGDENIRRIFQIKYKLESNKLTDAEIYESLRKLRSVVRCVSVIEATKIGRTISNFRSHRSKEISLLATIMTDQWKSMIVEFVDNKTAETTAEKSKNPATNFVLEEWCKFPLAEFVPQPPVEFPENFLQGEMDYYENAAGKYKDNNESDERQKHAAKENETDEVKLQESRKRERTKKESAEKFTSRRSNEPSTNKSNVKVEHSYGATTATEKNPFMGNKRKMEHAEIVTPIIKRQKVLVTPKQEESIRQKPSKSATNPKLPKTENPSDQKPRVKREVQNHNSETRTRYRALRMRAEPSHATPRVRESRRSSDNTAMEERLITSKKKPQAGCQAHESAKRKTQPTPEGDLHDKASTGRSKNQTLK